eukprot:GHUV01001044.1.p1 GENE.GHUV01001044.1~~GHUV01001044.1.p1  ORF type:complete len:416 (+),score=103.50 GHUV01001044.1:3-1250(+)
MHLGEATVRHSARSTTRELNTLRGQTPTTVTHTVSKELTAETVFSLQLCSPFAAGSCAHHRNPPPPLLSAANHHFPTMQLAARQSTRACALGTSRVAARPTVSVLARQSPSWVAKARQQETSLQESIEEGVNVTGEFCSIDSSGKRVRDRTIGEMEQEFLEALSNYYYGEKPSISDEEFELLKEELLWNGSKVAILDPDEQRFLEATVAYQKGKPILSDEDYDTLKADLKQKASIVSAQGPRCSIRSKKMYSDAYPDYLRMTALNLPAALLVLGFLFSIDDITGFEVTSLIELPPPGGIVALWAVVLPVLYLLSTSITNLVLRDHTILKGPCPNCGTDNFTYFGDIFTVAGNKGPNVLECGNCKADLTYDLNKRVIVVDRTPEEKAQALAAAAQKKAAAAAKKAAAAAKKAAKQA